MSDSFRPNPDELLKLLSQEERKNSQTQLRIFFGMSAGVGKTYAMLQAAHTAKKEGIDLVVGVVETHGRKETAALLEGLEIIPKKTVQYRGATLQEMDLDAILKRKPKLVVVDELAHSNIPGSVHPKRYQDVLQLLDAGIDVFTAINVQHIESRKDSVEKITGIFIRESVPDSILERANQIEVIDITPTELLKRLREGKVYLGEKAEAAAQNFFKEAPLSALREIALRLTAERVDKDLQGFKKLVPSDGGWNTNERLMVAVSHSPYSQRLIRATRRIAFSLEAPWIAVNIETGLSLNEADQNQLTKNLDLAHELGAEVITISDIHVNSALQRIAWQRNVTQIVIGRPTQRFFRDRLLGGTLLDILVRHAGDFDVHVIRQEGNQEKAKAGFFDFLYKRSSLIQYWYVLWALIFTTMASEILQKFVGFRVVGFFYLAAILVLSLFFSLGPVLFAATLSAVVWNFFFIPPIFTFVISSSEDIILCLSYFVVAITTGCLTHRLKRHEIIFKEREERTQILFQVTKDIAESSTKEKYLPKVSEQLDRILDGHSGFLIRSSNTQHLDASPIYSSTRLNLGEKDWAVAAWALENKKSAGWSTESLPLSKYIYIPLRSKQEVIGLFIFRSNKEKKLSLDKANLIASVLNQVSLSLERHLFEERSLAADRLHESEALHQALLNSVSHELKTPLTTIMSSARALNDPQLQEDAALRNEVSEDLLIASQRLNRVIDNLLDMTRLNSGILTLKKDWYDVLELIRLTIQNLQQDLHGRKIEVIGEDVPLVRVDYRLLEQVFSNLILNAHLYSPPNEPISILVEVAGAKLKILVRDRGIGIPETELENIFEKFYRLRKVNKEGSGLGLFIAKSFVDAHGGTLRARRLEKGTEFEILLPIEKTPPIFAIDDDDASENA